MPKVKVYYEVSKGVFKWMKKDAKDNEIKLDKKNILKIDDPNSEKRIEPNYTLEKTFWGRLLSLPLWTIYPTYMGSYKHGFVTGMGKVTLGTMDVNRARQLRREDVISELLTKNQKMSDIILFIGLAAAAAFMAGVMFGPQLTGVI